MIRPATAETQSSSSLKVTVAVGDVCKSRFRRRFVEIFEADGSVGTRSRATRSGAHHDDVLRVVRAVARLLTLQWQW
jgi:hypothetical protein